MVSININVNEWDEPDELGSLADAFAISSTPEDDEDARAAAAVDVTPTTPAGGEEGLEGALNPCAVRPEDPAEIGYPPTLPIELALKTAPEETIREAYEFTPHQWAALKRSSQFQRDLVAAQDMLRTEGMSFKAKARLQSEELLTTSWKMIHDARVPATVRADLIKFTVRAAGLEAKATEGGMDSTTPLQININM